MTFNTATLRPGVESKTRGNALTSAVLDTHMEAVGIVPLLALILLPFDCHVCCGHLCRAGIHADQHS